MQQEVGQEGGRHAHKEHLDDRDGAHLLPPPVPLERNRGRQAKGDCVQQKVDQYAFPVLSHAVFCFLPPIKELAKTMQAYEQRVQSLIQRLLDTAKESPTPAATPGPPAMSATLGALGAPGAPGTHTAVRPKVVYVRTNPSGDKAMIIVLIVVALLTGVSIGVGLCFLLRQNQDTSQPKKKAVQQYEGERG